MQSKDFDEEKGRKEEGGGNDVKKTRGKGLRLEKERYDGGGGKAGEETLVNAK